MTHRAAAAEATTRLSNIHIIVVGAGMAGLAVAAALEERGASVTVLEAADRVGGRNWTLRRGDGVPDLSNAPQTCEFSSGQYFNAGAWRIQPWHHRLRRLAQHHAIALEPLRTRLCQPSPLSWQPAGGMDRLPHAMAQALLTPVQTHTQVLRIQHSERGRPAGVSVLTQQGETTQWLEADYAVVSVPLHALGSLALPLPASIQQTLQQVLAADAIKIGFEMEGHMPQGQTEKGGDVRLLWPSGKSPLTQRICSVYGNAGAIANMFSTPRDRQIANACTLFNVAAPRADLQLSAPLVVQWSHVPFQQAAAARLAPPHVTTLRQLQAGFPPVFFAGDALSTLNGWQEGALESAEWAVKRLLMHHR